MSAPMAVVVSAMVTAKPSRPRAETPVNTCTAPKASASVTAHVAKPRLPSRPVMVLGLIS